MFRNGLVIGMIKIIIEPAPRMTLKGWSVGVLKCFAVVRLYTIRGSYALRTGISSSRRSDTTSSDFVYVFLPRSYFLIAKNLFSDLYQSRRYCEGILQMDQFLWTKDKTIKKWGECIFI